MDKSVHRFQKKKRVSMVVEWGGGDIHLTLPDLLIMLG
jgi:hypothetical protein